MFFLCLDDTDGADEANDAPAPFEDDDVEWRSTGDDEDEEFSKEELDRDLQAANLKGSIVSLGKYYPASGIP